MSHLGEGGSVVRPVLYSTAGLLVENLESREVRARARRDDRGESGANLVR